MSTCTEKQLMKHTEKKLKENLKMVGMPVKATYNNKEVCKILGISRTTFYKLVCDFKKNHKGHDKEINTLRSFLIFGCYRVHFADLVCFLNNHSAQNKADTAQDHLSLVK